MKSTPAYPICKNYYVSKTFNQNQIWLSALATYIINIILMSYVEHIIKGICCVNQVLEKQLIGISLFICVYLNTIVLPMLLNASFIEYGEDSMLNKMFS